MPHNGIYLNQLKPMTTKKTFFLDCPMCHFSGNVTYTTKKPQYCSNRCVKRAKRAHSPLFTLVSLWATPNFDHPRANESVNFWFSDAWLQLQQTIMRLARKVKPHQDIVYLAQLVAAHYSPQEQQQFWDLLIKEIELKRLEKPNIPFYLKKYLKKNNETKV